MNTREIAYSIFEQLNEEQLKGFIFMFKQFYPISTEEKEMTEKEKALQQLESMLHEIPDLDEKKELAKYREEKYGK